MTMKIDRFELEQNITACWSIIEDIKLLHENVLEKSMTTDDISNNLIGLEYLYSMKFEKLWETFEHLIAEKKIL